MINHRAIGVFRFLYMETFMSPSGSQDLTAFHQPSHQNWKFGTFAAAFVDTGCPQLHSWPQVSGICAWKLYLKLFIGPTQPKQNPEFVYIQKCIQKKCIVNWLLSPDIWRKTAVRFTFCHTKIPLAISSFYRRATGFFFSAPSAVKSGVFKS